VTDHEFCMAPGCERKREAKGLCNSHYRSWKRGNMPDHEPPAPRTALHACTIEGCGNGGRITRGMCMTHYKRWKRGTLEKPRYSRLRGSVGMSTEWPYEFTKHQGTWYRRPTDSTEPWEIVPGFLAPMGVAA
jgi:hypothetical protein